MINARPIKILPIVFSFLLGAIPVTFAETKDEVTIKLPPAVIIGEETMQIVDTRVPPMPTKITLGSKVEPKVDPRGLSDEILREVEKTSPVTKSSTGIRVILSAFPISPERGVRAAAAIFFTRS